jgi:2-dehydropantoate 2-reductase
VPDSVFNAIEQRQEAGMAAPRIAVLGTGANGAGIAADLVRAGHDVTFIEQWPAHVEAMRRYGITVKLPDDTEVTPVRVFNLCDVATLRDPFDLVFVVVKAYDTRWACELIKPHVAPDGAVVGLQNGMSIDAIEDILGTDRAIGAVIQVSSAMFVPGTVERHTPRAISWFALGGLNAVAHAKAEAIAPILGAAGTVEVVPDIRSAKWMKLVVNAGELVPSAILDLPMQAAVAAPGMRELMLRCCGEAIDAALADGASLVRLYGLPDLDLDDPRRFAEGLLDKVMYDYAIPTTLTTVLQDWMKGRHSEVDEVNGLVVEVLARAGREAPANARVVELAHRIEHGDLAAGEANLALLADSAIAVA